MQNKSSHRCGFVALVGRPNVGKSTLMNRLMGQKISIVTHKPQTTRHRVNGMLSLPQAQLIFVDTPGIHDPGQKSLNRQMNQAAIDALKNADVIVCMVMAGIWLEQDENVLALAKASGQPVYLAVNKVDTIKHRDTLLPWLEQNVQQEWLKGVFLVSAKKGSGVKKLQDQLCEILPEMPALYPEEQITNRSERFLVAELVREQLLRRMHKELPYGMHVHIEKFDASKKQIVIDATIWVARASHKGMVIGKQGSSLKQIGTAARKAIQKLLQRPVHLQLWVSVQSDWFDDPRRLESVGITDS